MKITKLPDFFILSYLLGNDVKNNIIFCDELYLYGEWRNKIMINYRSLKILHQTLIIILKKH
ncbi:Protein of unknown function [Gryllus bimaculatus]|nr:Protein of unknown function [Gryllus bimaculatus]